MIYLSLTSGVILTTFPHFIRLPDGAAQSSKPDHQTLCLYRLCRDPRYHSELTSLDWWDFFLANIIELWQIFIKSSAKSSHTYGKDCLKDNKFIHPFRTLFFFKILLLRYNWHAMNYTYLKCMIWYVLIYIYTLWNVGYNLQVSSCTFVISPSCPILTSSVLVPRQTLICFLSL